MENALSANVKVYTDMQSLQQLQFEKDTQAAKKEVAQQFEAIFMQMVLGSMRQANKAFDGGLLGSDQMDMYQDMFDKQLALAMSKSGVGFADLVEKNIDQMQTAEPSSDTEDKAAASTDESIPVVASSTTESAKPAANPVVAASPVTPKPDLFATPEDFINRLWSSAKSAAETIGTSPEILLAQAALETDWGKKILAADSSTTSHNLFNIKAGSNWNNKATAVNTLELKNGVLTKEKSNFRVYDSFEDSFSDYARLLKQTPRYNDSLTHAKNPEAFVNSLQQAGYATDQNYAGKVMKVFSSHLFQKLVAKVKSGI